MKYMLATLYRHFVFRLVPDLKYDVEITVTMHEMYVLFCPLLVFYPYPLTQSRNATVS